MEYKEIIEKVIEYIEKKHWYKNITIHVDNSQRLTVSEKKQTICPDEPGCHMSENESLDLTFAKKSEAKLYPSEKEEKVETPFYRIDLICEATHYDQPELFGYRAFVSTNDDKIQVINEDFNYIINGVDAKVYEEHKLPAYLGDSSEIALQAFAKDYVGLGRSRTFCDEHGYPVLISKGRFADALYVSEYHIDRSGELCIFTYADSMAHVFEYKGNLGGKSATEENVFYTFEDHSIHKYTIETSKEKGYHLYNGNINLKDEIYYEVPVTVEQYGDRYHATGEFFENLKVIHSSVDEDSPFALGIMKYNPMILTVDGKKRLLIKVGNEKPVLSEPYDNIELIDEPITHTDTIKLSLGNMSREEEIQRIEDALEFKCTNGDDISSLYLVKESDKPAIVKHMSLVRTA